jgi:metal-responsive CopG/Arc/MetJ family transcriptional regulator
MKELITAITVNGWSSRSEFVRRAIKEKIDKIKANDKR